MVPLVSLGGVGSLAGQEPGAGSGLERGASARAAPGRTRLCRLLVAVYAEAEARAGEPDLFVGVSSAAEGDRRSRAARRVSEALRFVDCADWGRGY